MIIKQNNVEVDFIELLKKIYKEKFKVLKFSLISALVGVLFSLIQTNEYTATTTFIPQLNSVMQTGNSSLSGIASIAGLNIGNTNNSSELPPSLYPQVVEGVPFRLELLSSNIILNDTTLTVRDFFNMNKSINLFGYLKKYTLGLPSLLINSFKDEVKINQTPNHNIYTISAEDIVLFDKFSKSFSLKVNDNEGFITISYIDSNKDVAAQMVQLAQNILQKIIIEFKNKSSKELFDFTIKQYNQKKLSFEKLQDERALFVDKNLNISSSLYQNKLSRIESELNISETVVQQLASQVEQARLQVNKDTPVFTTIQPVTIPFEKSSIRRSSIVIIFAFLGCFLCCLYIVMKNPIIDILNSIKS